ncbi:MAG: DUF1998 domain-containing protein, partial [Candidatus Sumerlaeia bacterium]|nr:DUF1998 domain-containing protein [Candidatus Sumerlaeia bacterium]
IGFGPVTLPQLEVQTEATWLVLPETIAAEWKERGLDLGVALKGVGELLRHTVPLFVLCDRRDFSVASMVRSRFDKRPAIYLWDRYPGGIGLARRIHSQAAMLLQAAMEMLDDCPCTGGCPSCIGPQMEMGSKAKEATRELLRAITR